jgi:hypothetical protein
LFNPKVKLQKCSNTSPLLSKKKTMSNEKKIINDDKNIPLATHGVNLRETDNVYME